MKDNKNDDEAGFGLVEIVVALFMLGVLAVAFLPLLIQGLKLSADNATRATATQILHDRLEAARLQSTSCAAITIALDGTVISEVKDPRGITFQVITDVKTCPTGAALPGTVAVSVEVRRTDDLGGTPLAQATTLIFVKT